jgi:hypothetical protein
MKLLRPRIAAVTPFLLAACAAPAPSVATPAPLAGDFAWTEVGPGGTAIARLVTEGKCPALSVDGKDSAMLPRGEPDAAFPYRVCEAPLPANAREVRAGEITFPAWNATPKRILFLGDTGCRIAKKKTGYVVQACNDPAKWPFPGVAAAAAAWKPDLVVHVGDYHYRESDCPAGNKGCEGSVTGDVWESWRQDFFTPARPLLRAAPWVFVRGNHELCARGGLGWFRLLEPRPAPSTCTDVTGPYELPFAGHRLFVIDSADEANTRVSLKSVAPSKKGELTWIALHRPFLTPGADDEAGEDESELNMRLPPALATAGAVASVFSGHRHVLSLNSFKDARPPELITGNGGDNLETAPKNAKGVKLESQYHDFGFLTLERGAKGVWKMEEHNRDGKTVLFCKLTEEAGKKTSVSCKK